MRPQDTFCFTGKTVDWVFSQLQTHKGWGTRSQKGVRPDMLWPLLAIHVHTSAIGKTRPRPRPHGVCGAEHERDGGDRALHRDSAGNSGDGRAAVLAGVVRGRCTFPVRWTGVGR